MPKGTPNERAAKRLADFKENKQKENAEIEQLKEQVTQAANGKTTKQQEEKHLTERQKAIRDAGKQARKDDPAGFYFKKADTQDSSRRNARNKKNEVKKRLETRPDEFEDYDEFIDLFYDEADCKEKAKKLKVNSDGKPTCPHCKKETKVYEYKTREIYSCHTCESQFRLTTGGIFEKSRIPFKNYFRLLFWELFITNGLTVEAAMNILKVKTLKTAHRALSNIRAAAFDQNIFRIKSFSVVVIDTSAVIGQNRNRQDHNKLTRKEIFARSKQILVFKTKDGIARAFVIDKIDAVTILKVIEKVIGKNSIIYSDEAKAFATIAEMQDKDFTHITFNHSAGEHGHGDAESVNRDLKKAFDAHTNNFSKQGVQLMSNAVIFKSNMKHRTICQQFNLALSNCMRFEKKDKQYVQPKRQSIFLKLVRIAANDNTAKTPAAIKLIPAAKRIAARVAASKLAA